jgi:uncharacterized protein (TIGR02186 family)
MNARRSLCLACATLALSFTQGLQAGGSPRQPRCEATDSAVDLRAEPGTIPIGLWYDGSEVRLTADVPPGMPVAILLEGKYAPLELKKKGKVWGVLWMNVGDLTYDEVPDAYILATSAPLRDLADEATLAHAGIGYPALALAAGGDAAFFGEVIKLQEHDGLFSQSEGTVKLQPTGGRSHVEATLPLHAHLPAGEYSIRLIGFDHGTPRCLGSTGVKLEASGVAKQLRALAMEQGLLYGITAVIVALVAGLATGLVFGKGASKAH